MVAKTLFTIRHVAFYPIFQMSLLKETVQNILINAEYNQSEEKNVHCTASEKKKTNPSYNK